MVLILYVQNITLRFSSIEAYFGVHSALPFLQTSSLKIALKVLGIGPGDEVITSSFNFIATIEAILDVGASPVMSMYKRLIWILNTESLI